MPSQLLPAARCGGEGSEGDSGRLVGSQPCGHCVLASAPSTLRTDTNVVDSWFAWWNAAQGGLTVHHPQPSMTALLLWHEPACSLHANLADVPLTTLGPSCHPSSTQGSSSCSPVGGSAARHIAAAAAAGDTLQAAWPAWARAPAPSVHASAWHSMTSGSGAGCNVRRRVMGVQVRALLGYLA
jgi:hypothetical protein